MSCRGGGKAAGVPPWPRVVGRAVGGVKDGGLSDGG
jgi:hypothetical protein